MGAYEKYPKRIVNSIYFDTVFHKNYIEAVEDSLGIKAKKELLPLQPGDVPDTFANVDDLVRDFNYKPSMSIKDGVKNFVDWYREYKNL